MPNSDLDNIPTIPLTTETRVVVHDPVDPSVDRFWIDENAIAIQQRAREVYDRIERDLAASMLSTPSIGEGRTATQVQQQIAAERRGISDHINNYLNDLARRPSIYGDAWEMRPTNPFRPEPFEQPVSRSRRDDPRRRPRPPGHWIGIDRRHGDRSLANRIVEDIQRGAVEAVHRRFNGQAMARRLIVDIVSFIESEFPHVHVVDIDSDHRAEVTVNCLVKADFACAQGEPIIRELLRTFAGQGIAFGEAVEMLRSAYSADVELHTDIANNAIVCTLKFGELRQRFTFDRYSYEREFRSAVRADRPRHAYPSSHAVDRFYRPTERDFTVHVNGREYEGRGNLSLPRLTARETEASRRRWRHVDENGNATYRTDPPSEGEHRHTVVQPNRLSGTVADIVVADEPVAEPRVVIAPAVNAHQNDILTAIRTGASIGDIPTVEATMPEPDTLPQFGGDEIDLMAAGAEPRPLEHIEPTTPYADATVEAAMLLSFMRELVPLLAEAAADISPEHMLRAELECSLTETRAMIARCTPRQPSGAPVSTNNPWGGRSRVVSADAD